MKLLIAERALLNDKFMYAKKKEQQIKLWEKIAKILSMTYIMIYLLLPAMKNGKVYLINIEKSMTLIKSLVGGAITWKYFTLLQEAIGSTSQKQAMSPPKSKITIIYMYICLLFRILIIYIIYLNIVCLIFRFTTRIF